VGVQSGGVWVDVGSGGCGCVCVCVCGCGWVCECVYVYLRVYVCAFVSRDACQCPLVSFLSFAR
jgi:hypothetical protein